MQRFNSKVSKMSTFTVNFGPQHPAAHGVLRLILSLDGENIKKCDPHIGLLHRGTEKLIENKIFVNSLPYFDRLDYVSVLTQEHAFCLSIETLKNKLPYNRLVSSTRTIFDELTRILNHYLAVSCHALDVGSMSPLFWCFEEREKIMEFYERISGARMHANFYKPCITQRVLKKNMYNDILNFINNTLTTVNELHFTLTSNKIWITRLKNIGCYSSKEANLYGASGVMARCTGLRKDLRLNFNTSYNEYYYLNINSYISNQGDSLSRYMLRLYEIIESCNIINQMSVIFKKNNFYTNNYIEFFNKDFIKMEDTIKHFKYWSEGFKIKKNQNFRSIESPKGEFGVFIITDNSNKPFRCKIRSSSYHHLQMLPNILQGLKLADIVTLIGTIDIVFGEIDR